MSDDWRLEIELHETGFAHALTDRFRATDLEHDLERAFQDRVVVSRDGAQVFCYVDSREQADRVSRLIQTLASDHEWHLDMQLRRWHPVAEKWEDPDVPIPDDTEAEHEELIDSERQELATQGYPDFDVRVECRSHRDAVELAEKLAGEGLPVVRRWKFLLVGAADEDSAQALAQRLRAEAPAGATVTVEGNASAVIDQVGPNPFAIFGGLGG
jgi:hypothetical protein